ncbi:MAG: MFS transporter [Proteobacteria bacterium]|nr:MFS transporter [Pseudomonadota bacterium]
MSERKRRSPLVIAFFTIFLDLLGFGIVIPVNSFYVESLGATPMTVTLLSASYSLMQFAFSPFWGRLSDRVGRRPVILISVAFSALGHLIFGLSGTIFMVFAARILAGFGNANLGTAQAIISDSTSRENRAKGMGIIGAAFGLGFLFGPAIGGFAGQYSPQAPALVAAALAVVNFALAYFFLPETRTQETLVNNNHHNRVFSLDALRRVASLPNVSTILKISFINTAAFAMFEVVIGLMMERSYLPLDDKGSHEHIAAAARLTAWFLVTVGIMAVIVQGGLIGRLNKKFGEIKLIHFGLVAMTISVAAMPVFAAQFTYPTMLILAALLAVGTGVFNPSQSALISKSAPQNEQGEVLGLNQSMSALGRVAGPVASGWLFERQMGFPFYVAAMMSAIALILSLQLKPQELAPVA